MSLLGLSACSYSTAALFPLLCVATEISLPLVDWQEDFVEGIPLPTQAIAVEMHSGR